MNIKGKLAGFKESLSNIKHRAELAHSFYMGKFTQSGQATDSMINKVVGIAVALLVTGIIFPIALDELAGASVPSDMPGVEPLLKTLLPVLAVIGVVLYIVR